MFKSNGCCFRFFLKTASTLFCSVCWGNEFMQGKTKENEDDCFSISISTSSLTVCVCWLCSYWMITVIASQVFSALPIHRRRPPCSFVARSWTRRTCLANLTHICSSTEVMKMDRKYFLAWILGQSSADFQMHFFFSVLKPSVNFPLTDGKSSGIKITCRYTVVHKTEVIKNTLNPTWRPFTVPVRALCNGDYDRYDLN